MKIVDKLHELKKSQNELLSKFNEIINEAEKSDNIVENEKLRDRVAKLDKSLNEIEKKYKKLLDENQKLKLSLNEQIIDEKLNILKVSQEKLDLYFGKSKTNNQNNLKKLEFELKRRIDKFRQLAESNLSNDKKEALKEIGDLEVKLSEKIKKEREKLKEAEDALLKDIKKGIKDLSSKDIDEETIRKRIRQNKLEMKIGLSWLNKIGMVLIIIAIGITAYYNRTNVNNYIKGILFFLTGIASLGVGEFFYRKQKEVFATGLLGGGIAILYSAIFFSYFLLKENGAGIINTPTALILSVVVSLTAVALSIRYDSKTVISIGLIGGYLPFLTYSIAFGFKGTELYYGMSYLFILNLLVLAISFWKQWRVSNYISFLLNIPSMIYLLDGSPNKVVALIYAVLTFAMYLGITLAYPLIYKKALKIPDLILLGLNTFASSVIFYYLFDELKWNDFYGVLALVICLVYAGLGYFTNRVMKAEKGSVIIFYLTALTFAVLMIPFQLAQYGENWFMLGWLVEGTLLVVYGYKKNIKPLEIAGWVIFGLCLFVFYIFDLIGQNYTNEDFFILRYFFVMAGTVLILMIYQLDLLKNKLSEFSVKGKFLKGFKYFTVSTFYIFLLYVAFYYYYKLFDKWTYTNNIFPYYLYKFYMMILFALITMGFGLLLKRLKLFYDNVVKIFSIVLFLIADFLCFIIILSKPLLSHSILNFTDNETVGKV